MDNFFYLNKEMSASADEKLAGNHTEKLWNSFSCTASRLNIRKGQDLTFVLGDVKVPTLSHGKEFSVVVCPEGIAVRGRDFGGLMRGYFALLMKMLCTEKGLCKIPYCSFESTYLLDKRMIHICLFPENDINYAKKIIRLAGLCQFTHIVIEFWGTFKFDCLKELSWPDAFTKAEAKEIIDEARALGMEPIPMFNMLGHAALARALYGKHTILDQSPSLQYLFTPDGWAWDIASEEVYSLLKSVRGELYDLFGEGEYIHIGCDEAYFISKDEHLRKTVLPQYLKRLTNDIVSEGRKPMLWMDMFIEKDRFKDCYAYCPEGEQKMMLSSLNPKSVAVDWQYDIKSAPLETLEHLKDVCKLNIMGAPWYDFDNIDAHIQTLIKNKLFGIMLTTWQAFDPPYIKHTSVYYCAKQCGATFFDWAESGIPETITSTLLRRVNFENEGVSFDYKNTGFNASQLTSRG